jgi:hypothetical protein
MMVRAMPADKRTARSRETYSCAKYMSSGFFHRRHATHSQDSARCHGSCGGGAAESPA